MPGGIPEAVAAAALDLADFRGIYYSLNPVRPDLAKSAAAADSLARRWFYIDCDPVKAEPDASATDAEKGAAAHLAADVVADLSGRGWPQPILIDSGNGFNVSYRVDLPNDTLYRQWFSAALKALAALHDRDGAKVDVKVFNSARIAKLPGTWAQKGPNTDDRPHRLCRLRLVPDRVEIVQVQLLKALANGPSAVPTPSKAETNGHGPTPTPWQVRASSGGLASYVKAAVDKELTKVALAAVGERNNALNEAAFSLGTLLDTREVTRDQIASQLEFAAKRAGLVEAEIRPTIKSGLDAGAAHPRTLPETLAVPTHVHRPETAPTVKPDPDERLVGCVADVTSKVVPFLWPNRIPYRFISTFAGRTGLGKSFVTCDIVARTSLGMPWPDLPGECAPLGSTLFITEDLVEYMLAPRLIETGADTSKVYYMLWEAMAHYTLADMAMLDRAMRQAGDPTLIVIDPPTNFLGVADEHRNAEVRQVLMGLAAWLEASERDVACILITHVNKSTGRGIDALSRVLGSVAFTSVARIVHLFAPDTDDPSRRLFVPSKTNVGPLGKGLAYRITRTETLARVEWLGEVETSADEAMDHDRKPVVPDATRAAGWLREFLADGPKMSEECIASGNTACDLDRPMYWWRDKVLKAHLGGISQRQGFAGHWAWLIQTKAAPVPNNAVF